MVMWVVRVWCNVVMKRRREDRRVMRVFSCSENRGGEGGT